MIFNMFSTFTAKPIPAVSEFVAQLQIVELVDNVREDLSQFNFTRILPGHLSCVFFYAFA